MTIDTSDLLNSILGSLSRIDYIKPEEVPNIPLYMDQVTTFMDADLRMLFRVLLHLLPFHERYHGLHPG